VKVINMFLGALFQHKTTQVDTVNGARHVYTLRWPRFELGSGLLLHTRGAFGETTR
jgi:hypothetical protein